MTAALSVVGRRRPSSPAVTQVDRLSLLLDQRFLTDAGWDPVTQVLAPPAEHPQLGYRPCVVTGCTTVALQPSGLCVTCQRSHRGSGVALEKFLAWERQRVHVRGDGKDCAVHGCERPARTHRTGLCITHGRQCDRRGLTTAVFTAQPDVVALQGFGGCRVKICRRRACGGLGLCHAHEARWSTQRRTVPQPDFDTWCATAAPVAAGHLVVLRGLPPLVQAEILYGVQERSRLDTRTELFVLRCLVRRLICGGYRSIVDFDAGALPRHQRVPLTDLQRAVTRLSCSAQDEQDNDVWNMHVFGHGRKRLDFTVITQPWLRDAAKRWVAEELPLRRGPNVVAVLREHVNSLAELGRSLRRHRADDGLRPGALGRGDIVAFLNWLSHQQTSGQISAHQRRKLCQHAALVLKECRAMGLGRRGQPMAGLGDEFAFHRHDLPPVPADDSPGRALPVTVLNTLVAGLDLLESQAGRDARVAVQILIDTGRRPAEVCQLPWDCLAPDADGKYALIYTDFKNNRVGRRLPIADATAAVIAAQQRHVRDHFPGTPLAELALLPRPTRNPHGRRPLSDDVLATMHRRWVDSLEPLHRPDSSEFDKAAIVLYAYRHSFAQRHADAGTPVDVLRELMGHRSMATTQIYYNVTANRVRNAVDKLATYQFNGQGQPVWRQARALLESEHQRLAVGQVAVPFGICTEPSNVKAAGGACPFRFRCLGCAHFRSDPSYLPELRDYLDTLLRDRERIRAATELDTWARTDAMPSEEEITRLRTLIRRVEHDLDNLNDQDRQQITDAVRVVRRTRQTVHLGMPTITPPSIDIRLEPDR